MRVVFENLIGNAWKFTGKVDEAHIEFGVETRDDGTVFFVRDNGAGFDMAFADTLFARSSGCTGRRTFPAPASASRRCIGSSTATAAGSGPRGPSAEAPPSSSPCRRRGREARRSTPRVAGQRVRVNDTETVNSATRRPVCAFFASSRNAWPPWSPLHGQCPGDARAMQGCGDRCDRALHHALQHGRERRRDSAMTLAKWRMSRMIDGWGRGHFQGG